MDNQLGGRNTATRTLGGRHAASGCHWLYIIMFSNSVIHRAVVKVRGG